MQFDGHKYADHIHDPMLFVESYRDVKASELTVTPRHRRPCAVSQHAANQELLKLVGKKTR